jgi:electron transfer flavoprotein beta subunit
MKIVAAIKVVPDDEAIKVAGDRSLDASKAKEKISTYDLNAIEAGAQLAAATGGNLVAISASYEGATSKKVQKDILARGPEELFAYGDAKLATADSLATAKALQALLAQVGDYDLVLCGDGSADMFAGAVDAQLAALLDVPVVNKVTKITPEGDKVVVERTLDTVVEEIEVPLPAVISVSPEIAQPRITGMKDIMAAGKKPAHVDAIDAVDAAVEVAEIKAPEAAPRKQEIFGEDDVAKFAAALAEAIR